MSDFEPVMIKGVVAFPNPDKEQQYIRFIDSRYNRLFTVPNGGNVVLTYFDGKTKTLPCEYIDDYHAQIGSNVYHICEFAELMERRGAVYAPEHPTEKDVCDTYEIYQIRNTAKTAYSFCSYDEAKKKLLLSDYRRVYAGMLAPKVTMEDLSQKHKRDTRFFEGEMRSLSVSDIIVITRNGEKKAFYVNDVGFTEIKTGP